MHIFQVSSSHCGVLMVFFWDKMPFNFVDRYECFGEMCCLHLHSCTMKREGQVLLKLQYCSTELYTVTSGRPYFALLVCCCETNCDGDSDLRSVVYR